MNGEEEEEVEEEEEEGRVEGMVCVLSEGV